MNADADHKWNNKMLWKKKLFLWQNTATDSCWKWLAFEKQVQWNLSKTQEDIQ